MGKSFTETIKKITIVLESYNEDIIKEAIEKGLILDVKNLNESDIEKTIKFLAGNIKDNRSDGNIIAAEELYNEKARFFRKTNNQKKLPKKQNKYRDLEHTNNKRRKHKT